MEKMESGRLTEISKTIVQLRLEQAFTIDALVEKCGPIVTFERLQQLKRPENRRKFEGRVSNKAMRRRLAAKLLPQGIWNQNQIVYANIDIPEDEVLEYDISAQDGKNVPSEPLSISLFTPEMYEADADYIEGRDLLLNAVYAPYCYRFTLGHWDKPGERDGRGEGYCSFEELCARVQKVNGGNSSRWFCAKLFEKREDALKAGMGEPLCGEVEFICGRTSIETAYLCITNGEAPSDVVDFYERSTASFEISVPTSVNSIGTITSPPSNTPPAGGTPNAVSPSSGSAKRKSYEIKLYNTGQGNCIYLVPKNAGKQKKFFFDVGASCYPNNQAANEAKAAVKAAYANIGSSYPDFIVLSHWHRDHYNLIYKFNNLVTCPWIIPAFPAKFPKSNTSVLNVLRKKNLFHLFGSIEASRLIQGSIVHCEKGSGSDCNNSGLLIQMQQTLLPGDCGYMHWPSTFAAGQKFRYMVVPHHGAHIYKTEAASKGKPLPPNVTAALDHAAEVYVCTGENNYGHPTEGHMDALNNHLCGNTPPIEWDKNPQIYQTKTSNQSCFTWDDI